MILPLVFAVLAADTNSFIRTNQVGYLPDSPKIAVICSLDSTSFSTFEVRGATRTPAQRTRCSTI